MLDPDAIAQSISTSFGSHVALDLGDRAQAVGGEVLTRGGLRWPGSNRRSTHCGNGPRLAPRQGRKVAVYRAAAGIAWRAVPNTKQPTIRDGNARSSF